MRDACLVLVLDCAEYVVLFLLSTNWTSIRTEVIILDWIMRYGALVGRCHGPTETLMNPLVGSAVQVGVGLRASAWDALSAAGRVLPNGHFVQCCSAACDASWLRASLSRQ